MSTKKLPSICALIIFLTLIPLEIFAQNCHSFFSEERILREAIFAPLGEDTLTSLEVMDATLSSEKVLSDSSKRIFAKATIIFWNELARAFNRTPITEADITGNNLEKLNKSIGLILSGYIYFLSGFIKEPPSNSLYIYFTNHLYITATAPIVVGGQNPQTIYRLAELLDLKNPNFLHILIQYSGSIWKDPRTERLH